MFHCQFIFCCCCFFQTVEICPTLESVIVFTSAQRPRRTEHHLSLQELSCLAQRTPYWCQEIPQNQNRERSDNSLQFVQQIQAQSHHRRLPSESKVVLVWRGCLLCSHSSGCHAIRAEWQETSRFWSEIFRIEGNSAGISSSLYLSPIIIFANIFQNIHWNGKRPRRQRNHHQNIRPAETTQWKIL